MNNLCKAGCEFFSADEIAKSFVPFGFEKRSKI